MNLRASEICRNWRIEKKLCLSGRNWRDPEDIWSREDSLQNMGNSPGRNATEPAVAEALTSDDQKSSRRIIEEAVEDEGGLDSSLIKDVGKYTWYTFK